MELSKKTTLLFPPELHDHLARLARHKGVSLGQLVRRACEAQYGFVSTEARVAAALELAALALPVGDPDQLEQESVPRPGDLLP